MKKSTIVLLLVLMLSPAAAISAEKTSADCRNCRPCEVQSHAQNLAGIPINCATESICLMCPIEKPVLLPDFGIDFSIREVDNFNSCKQARIDGSRLFHTIGPLQITNSFYLRC